MSAVRRDVDLDDFLREFEGDPAYEATRASLRAQTNLAINVHRLRAALDLSQEDVARRAGMRQPAVSKIERGDSNPRLDTLSRLARALGVEVDALFLDPAAVEESPRIVQAEVATAPARYVWSRVAQANASSPLRPSDAAHELFALVA